MAGRVTAVIGGQYGSEGKGALVQHVADQYQIHVRVGGPNAGHTIYYQGIKFPMQVIPCGWINPEATLVLGRGMVIDIHRLKDEISAIKQFDTDIESRIKIDSGAGVISDYHRGLEGGRDGDYNKRIGSTGEGIGEARMDRIKRVPGGTFRLIGEIAEAEGIDHMIINDTPGYIACGICHDKNVLLEGTQGSGLSLIHGPWPYVTSADTNAAQLLADVGVAPKHLTNTILVCRTYPIRVAGNSGPLAGEITWEQLSAAIGKEVCEQTTVTKKVRRVAKWDSSMVRHAVNLNAPDCIALMFMDYINIIDEGTNCYQSLSLKSKDFIDYVERSLNTYVRYIGTGMKADGSGIQIIDRGNRSNIPCFR